MVLRKWSVLTSHVIKSVVENLIIAIKECLGLGVEAFADNNLKLGIILFESEN